MLTIKQLPWPVRPVWFLVSLIGALAYCTYLLIIELTCKIEFEGSELNNYPGHIIGIWHNSFPLYFAAFYRKLRHYSLMSHPAWYMLHVFISFRLLGIKHVHPGSSGYNGMKALNEVIGDLKQGYSTVIACDGPYGPIYQVKKGVLIASAETGLPLIAARFKCRHRFLTGEWDKKKIPLPFSKIVAQLSPPYYVNSNNAAEIEKSLTAWLNFREQVQAAEQSQKSA